METSLGTDKLPTTGRSYASITSHYYRETNRETKKRGFYRLFISEQPRNKTKKTPFAITHEARNRNHYNVSDFSRAVPSKIVKCVAACGSNGRNTISRRCYEPCPGHIFQPREREAVRRNGTHSYDLGTRIWANVPLSVALMFALSLFHFQISAQISTSGHHTDCAVRIASNRFASSHYRAEQALNGRTNGNKERRKKRLSN